MDIQDDLRMIAPHLHDLASQLTDGNPELFDPILLFVQTFAENGDPMQLARVIYGAQALLLTAQKDTTDILGKMINVPAIGS